MGLLSFLSKLTNGDHDEDLKQGMSPHKFGYDPDGYLTAQTPGASSDIVINGGPRDPWKPKGGTVLGAIADAIANYTGDGTPFADARDERNIHEAMQGFTANPMQAARRLGMIKGHESDAWKMRNDEVDNTRQQGNLDRQNRTLDIKNEDALIARAAGALRNADPSTYPVIRSQIQQMAANRGLNIDDILPEQFDPTYINGLVTGQVPVAKQVTQEETARYHRDTSDYRNRNLQERSGYHQGQLGLGSQRTGIQANNSNETGRHNKETEATADFNAHKNPGKAQTSGVNEKGPYKISPDGTELHLYHKNGKQYRYINIGNTNGKINWRLAGEITQKEKEKK